MNICLDSYKSIIFDFDGVIVDSNGIKKRAITDAVTGILSTNDVKSFVNYFTQNNGLPRRLKIDKFIKAEFAEEVLQRYEAILKSSLLHAPLIPGVKEFIQDLSSLSDSAPMYVLSGGEFPEIEKILKYHDLFYYFDGIFASPNNKEQNLALMKLEYPVVFFGDSQIDYHTALNASIDFVFVYGATDWQDWRSTIELDSNVSQLQDFR